MKTRIISACVMLPLFGVVILGGYWLMGAGAVFSAIALREFYLGFKSYGINPKFDLWWMAPLGFYFLIIFNSVKGSVYDNNTLAALWLVIIVMVSLIYGFNVEERKPYDVSVTLMGPIYCVLLLSNLVFIDMTEYRIFVWLAFTSAFGTDIFAYFTGYAIGKHKLCPKLSPKKTVEGAVGGTVGAVAMGLGFALLFAKEEIVACLIISFVGSIFSQLGDLSASALKRQIGIKDYGNLIPGHGGVLDRFDSVFFTAPVVYFSIVFFLQ